MREEGDGGILEGGVKTSDEGRPVMRGDEGGMLFSCQGQFRAVYFCLDSLEPWELSVPRHRDHTHGLGLALVPSRGNVIAPLVEGKVNRDKRNGDCER